MKTAALKLVPLVFTRLILLALLPISSSASNITSTVVTSLPGYSGDLPFALETGYIGVGDDEEAQIFYYFIESQRNSAQDPLLLWISGGPGCSSIAGFFFESGPIMFNYNDYNGSLPTFHDNPYAWTQYFKRKFTGPIMFNYNDYNGSLPTFHDNPYAWTQGLNIIYLDAPVGTGFSYSNTQSGYLVDDYIFVDEAYEFLQKWLDAHPTYLENQLYIGGDSYTGIPLPILAEKIVNGNENGSVPMMNFKGYILGNPVTDSVIDVNSRVVYAHRLSLISDQLYKDAKTSCNGDYVNIDASNDACLEDVDAINALTSDINLVHILEPSCTNALPTAKETVQARRYLEDLSKGLLSSPPSGPALWCRSYYHMLAYVWANDKGVQDALGVRRGTKHVWKYCNSTMAYTKVATTVVSYHQNLAKLANLRVLVYSGDHDMSIPHIGTQEWINTLNLTVTESWRTWSLHGQTAGYTKKLVNEYFSLTYVTVKGAGHFAAEYKIEECAAMIDRWMAYFPL